MEFSSDMEEILLDAYQNTDESIIKISKRLGIKYYCVRSFINRRFDTAFRADRDARARKASLCTVSDMQMNELVKAYSETDEALNNICKRLSIGYGTAHSYLLKYFGREYMHNRHFSVLSKNTRGIPNGRTGEKHPRYSGGRYLQKFKTSKDPYWMVIKPAWYLGAKNTRYVPEHVVVACKAVHITKLPRSFVVHHCDQDHFNNEFDNLVIMSKSDHNTLHHMLTKESVTTMGKPSTLKWLAEARGFVLSEWLKANDDIVFSEQECSAVTPSDGQELA